MAGTSRHRDTLRHARYRQGTNREGRAGYSGFSGSTRDRVVGRPWGGTVFHQILQQHHISAHIPYNVHVIAFRLFMPSVGLPTPNRAKLCHEAKLSRRRRRRRQADLLKMLKSPYRQYNIFHTHMYYIIYIPHNIM